MNSSPLARCSSLSAARCFRVKQPTWIRQVSISTRDIRLFHQVSPLSRPDYGHRISPLHRPSRRLQSTASLPTTKTTITQRNVFIALGSNMGNRVENIENACRAIDEDPDMRIVNTSCLYETEPMYVEDQDRFVNGACEIETSLEPLDLLDRLQSIEKALGRVKLIDKGPRAIDLDIIRYADRVVHTDRLIVPHALMTERMFVLRPLGDLENARHWKPSSNDKTVSAYLRQESDTLPTITPLGPAGLSLHATSNDRTHIMSILNVTPDSFSDGGVASAVDGEGLRSIVASHIAAGATIIDIGGQSSRPNAADVTAEQEIARVLPAIETIKSIPGHEAVAISVDTYRAAVAEAAIQAGAHIVNDISAGLLDPEMLPTVARLGCTYGMMHMRGTPSTMSNAENCSYPHGLIPTIRKELSARMNAAIAAGIRRWRIFLDPGVGFAKTTEQNLTLLRHLSDFKAHDDWSRIPWLVGSSRKKFIGEITGEQEPRNRLMGTAASVTAAVAGGANVVRVHDVKKMRDVVRMADAIYRRRSVAPVGRPNEPARRSP